MDQFDRAQELDAHYLRQALEEASRNRPRGEARSHCLDCGRKIPEARRQAVPGCERCVACAGAAEQGGR